MNPGRHRQAISGTVPAAEDPEAPSPRRGPARGWFVGEGPRVRGRAVWLMLAFAGLAATLVVHLGDVQVVEHASLSAAAAAAHEISFTLPAQRGEILDSQGRVLVSTQVVYSVHVDPALIPPAERAQDAAEIAHVLGLSGSVVAKALAEHTEYAYLADGVSVQVKDQLSQLPIAGIILQPEDQPVYEPSPVAGESFAADLLGFVNASGQGQYGVEGYYNSLLTGKQGSASEVRDSQGNAIYLNRGSVRPARNGDTLQLGLDSQVQYWAEQDIAAAVARDHAQSGEILVMDTHTGAIAAWADYPGFNANTYASTPVADFLDPAISSLYAPGSVMKVVTFAGGLNNRAITPGYTFNEQQTVVDGVLIHDWDRRSHGWITMQTVLDDSLNNGAMKVMRLEGVNAFYDNLLAFGIGAPTGVDLQGEVNQQMAPQSRLNMLDYSEMSFGQSIVVTPVEMLAAINAVANGGVWVQPHAVTSIINPNTGRTTAVTPATRRVISAQAASTLTTMLTHVVDDPGAEGFAARIPGWTGEIAAKTGTAQEDVNGSLSGTDVSFAGFLPASNPQFTMMVLINEPQVPASQDYGSVLAGPVWHEMSLQMIDHWHLTP